jgi:hypothetical protein
MRFCDQPHRFYCGVDLHARTMYLLILDGARAWKLSRFPRVRSGKRSRCLTLKMCLVQLRAETSKWRGGTP